MIIVGIVLLLIMMDILWSYYRKPSQSHYQFSRYNMFTKAAGTYHYTMSKNVLNIKSDAKGTLLLTPQGFHDELKQSNHVLLGGSAAFGIGAKSNDESVSGILRKKYGFDIINLSCPGWNLEQEVLTLFKHWDIIQPKKIILFDGCNNLALGLPFDYNNVIVSPDPIAFYEEKHYQESVDRYFIKNIDIKYQTFLILRELWRCSSLRKLSEMRHKTKKCCAQTNIETSSQSIPDMKPFSQPAVDNYLHWLSVLRDICQARSVDLIVAIQPYYFFGKTQNDLKKYQWKKANGVFDAYILNTLNDLDSKLISLQGITYLPLFKLFKDKDLSYFIDAVHMTASGYELVADHLFEHIKGAKNVSKTQTMV